MQQLVREGTFDGAMVDLNAMDARFMHHLAQGPGIRDFALTYPGLNLTHETESVLMAGISRTDPIPMERTRTDGELVS